jgi:hypothetical protein
LVSGKWYSKRFDIFDGTLEHKTDDDHGYFMAIEARSDAVHFPNKQQVVTAFVMENL